MTKKKENKKLISYIVSFSPSGVRKRGRPEQYIDGGSPTKL